MKKLLGIFAHPDDESYMAGGTLAKYAKSGCTVDLVCATRGEAAARGVYQSANTEVFGEVRAQELADASALIGVRSITFLDYKDGGLPKLSPGEIEDKLMGLFAGERPDIVITYEPSGVTNHPDHTKLTLATTFAFQKYAFDRASENPTDSNPPKLYYACEPESIVSYFVKKKYYPHEASGKPMTGVEDKRITTVIDIRRTSSAKAKALMAYVSQKARVEEYLGIERNPFLSQEYFILRYVGENESFMGKNDRVSDRL